MSDKQRLQVNNTNLSDILLEIGDLPLKALVEAAAREGQYVWKKYDAPHFTLKFSVTNSSSPYNLKVDCAEVDLTKVDSSWFAGIRGVWNGNGYYEFPDGNTLRIFDGSNIYNFASVWNASTTSFTVTSASGIGNTSQFAPYVADGTFVGYVVNDSELAYPDGDMQDGNWYERLSGIQGIDYGKVTVTTAQGKITVNHSLKRVPTYAYLITDNTKISSNNSTFSSILTSKTKLIANADYPIYGIYGYSNGYQLGRMDNVLSTFDDKSITFNPSRSRVEAGDYIWIAIA